MFLFFIGCAAANILQYNMVKKLEHFWKGMGGHESQISPIPPERYGDRFIRFISGITMSRERAEQARLSDAPESSIGVSIPHGIEGTVDDPRLGGVNIHRDTRNPAGTDKVMERAEHEAERSKRQGANEDDVPDRSLSAVRSPGDPHADAATLPVIGEAAENASNASRTPSRLTPSHSRDDVSASTTILPQVILGNANMPSDALGEVPPPTPQKTDEPPAAARESIKYSIDRSRSLSNSNSIGGGGGAPPPTPPKDEIYRSGKGAFVDSEKADREILEHPEKDLPTPPVTHKATKELSHSPSRIVGEEVQRAREFLGGGRS